MKHAVKGKKLNRDTSSRRSLFKNLTLALIEHGHIVTTQAKASAIKGSFDKLLTKAKQNTLTARRLVDKKLNQRHAVNQLVDVIAPATKRVSGFTRITKLGMRRGDAAEMVKIEIIDWQPKVEAKLKKVEKTKKEAIAKTTAHVHDEKEVVKTKLPSAATSAPKHVPQKRIAGGGK